MRCLILLSLLVPLIQCFLPPPVTAPTDRVGCLSQPSLICNLASRGDRNISGSVVFKPDYKSSCRVRIYFNISGLTRKQAIHIHTYGDLTSPSFLSLGGHFTSPSDNPDTPDEAHDVHGWRGSARRHWGDFGNMVGADGRYEKSRVDHVISLGGILGRGVIIHEGADQGPKAQPSGASGSRVAGCVIGFKDSRVDS